MAESADQAALAEITTRIQAGDLNGARECCSGFLRAVSDAVRQAPVRAWLGWIEQKSGSLDAAAAQFELALTAVPHQPAWRLQLGLIRFRGKDFAGAEAAYRQVLELQPGHPLALYNLGILQQHLRAWDAARASFEAAITANPAFPEALNNLAVTLEELSDFAGANRRFRQALAVNPHLATAHYGLGRQSIRDQQPAEAGAHFARAVRDDPDFIDAWLALADCHHAAGDRGRAIACADAVLAREPGHETAHFKRALYAGDQPEAAPPAMIERLYDNMAGTFDGHLVGHLGYRLPQQLLEALQPWLAGFREAHARQPDVLDLGCGTGLFGAAIRPHAARLTGVDLSPAMLDKARQRGVYDALAQSDLLTWLEGPAAPVDLIAATDVLIYLGRLDALFSQIVRHLPSGGRFAFSTESPPDLPVDFRLEPTARYSHRAAYIERLAAGNAMHVVTRLDTVIRSEKGLPVAGHLFILAKD